LDRAFQRVGQWWYEQADAPIRLKNYATASLPGASDWRYGLVYDSTAGVVKCSDGSNWLGGASDNYTVATLPAAGTIGRRAFVTDANATTFASIVASGGANKVPVFDDGTNWRIG
jgi:hypothetical protein